VNNTTGIVPPSSDCANYTMTVTLCPSTVAMTASRTPSQATVFANSLGQAVIPLTMKYQNTGDFTATVSAATVSETLQVSVFDGQFAAVNTQVGKGGAIVPPGAFITQTFPLEFSGSQFTCLPRTYTVSSQLTAVAEPYYCNGYNPPSAVVKTGSVLPLDNFDEDTFAFQSLPGTFITVTVDTVSAATAFDIEACVSGTPNGTCLPGFQGDDNFTCTFPPPAFACPQFGGTLPADPDDDNIYYARINSGSGASNFAGPTGDYRVSVLVTAGPTGACPLIPTLDNGANSFLMRPSSVASTIVPSATITGNMTPITIIVPPSNPSAPGCSQTYLPALRK
jgi:hypothetical protein